MNFRKFCRKYKLNNFRLYNISLIILFLILSFIAVYPFWKTGYLYSGSDMQFHLSRIQEWVDDIKQNGILSHPIIATHTFNEIGDASTSMYPWVTLYPFVLLMLIMKPINAIYVGFIIIIFITLLLAYYSLFIVTRSKHLSFYFAILYGLTTNILDETLNFDTGTSLAYPFLPVAFVGLYMVMKGNYKKWYWLTLGVTGILYSHAASAFLFVSVFFIIYIIYYHKQPRHKRWLRVLYLVLASVVTFVLNIRIWIPLVYISMKQKLTTPNAVNLKGGSGTPYAILATPFQNKGFSDGLGFFIVITVIVGFIFLWKTPKSVHKYYYFGLLSLLFVSSLFPWNFVSTTPGLKLINVIQRTSRFYPVSILLLSIYGAYALSSLSHYHAKKIIIGIVLVILTIFVISNFNESGLYTNKLKAYTTEMTLPYKTYYTHQVPSIAVGGYRVNNSMYNNQFPGENETGMEDYVPASLGKTFGDVASKGTVLNNQHFNINEQDIHHRENGIDYSLTMPMTKGTSLDLPFINYKALKYHVVINGKKVHPYRAKNSTLKIYIPHHISSKANILIKSSLPYDIELTTITWISWFLLIFFIFKYRIKRKI